jgi:integrase
MSNPKHEKRRLTDRFIKTRPPAAPGQRDEYLDSDARGLALRVTDRGYKSFVLRARFPGHAGAPAPFVRRAIGEYPEVTLDEARDTADRWRRSIKKGDDPRAEERRQRAAKERERGATFGVLAADFLERYASRLAKKGQATAIINAEFVARWKDWPVADVTPQECAQAVRAIVERGSPYQAHNAFGYLRRLYNWAIASGEYGIDASPVARLRPSEIIGKREARIRVLNDVELRRMWRAAYGLGYPYGPLVHLLILTGQREREVADMTWREIDLDKKLWTIPAERMKGARSHEVPLPDAAVAILEALPEWSGGDCVFTTTDGETSVNGFAKAKVRIDKLVADVAEHDGATDEMPRWVFHDLRRTMRTHLSALPVQDMVRELVIAHAKPGLHKVYDQHGYLDEKRECLRLWEARLRGIIAPPVPRGENVVAMRAGA